jgi:glucan phosphoethanolaminetransferase (alkaline phosphatase superfamily)
VTNAWGNATTAGLFAGLTLLVLANRWLFLRRQLGMFWSARQQAGISLAIAGVLMLIVATANSLAVAPLVIAAPLLAVVLLYDTADLTSFRYFGMSVSENYRHLPISAGGWNMLRVARAYVRSYVPASYFVASCFVGLVAPLVAARWLSGDAAWIIGSFGTAIGLTMSRRRRRHQPAAMSAIEQRIALAQDDVAVHPLHRRTRAGLFDLRNMTDELPKTVLLVILESTGRHFPSSQNPDVSLADRIRQSSGDYEAWLAPTNAITNSSCTDVILPSILTGVAPHESSAKLHRMPFLFDLAKARGYRTGFFSSTTLTWARLDRFFAGARVDTLFTADDAGLPYINELAVDDHAVARRMGAWFNTATGPTFAVFYSNALHMPFQRDSEIEIPASLEERRDRATYIVEKQLELLLETLKGNGEFDNALIVVVGDHGESIGEADIGATPQFARATILSEQIIRPLFLLKPPANLSPERAEILRRNANRLICHIDLAPTIADLLGVELSPGLAYAGQSLLRPVADDRILYVLNTNEWRSWPRTAVGIFRGQSSIIADDLDEALCRYAGAAMSDPVFGRDALLASAMAEPLVQRALTRVFRDKLNLAPRGGRSGQYQKH